MEDTCIKVISEEHGEEIINYYNSIGVNTEGYSGNTVGWYYGVFYDKFSFNETSLNSKVIELPTTEKQYHFTKEELENLLHKCWIQSTRKQLEPLTEFGFRTFIEKHL